MYVNALFQKIITNFLNNLPKGNTVSIPIHSSICSIRLSHFIHKLKVKKEEFLDKYLKAYPRLPIKVRKSFKEFMKHLSDNELADEFSEDSFYTHECPDEEKVLRNAIASKISKLKVGGLAGFGKKIT